jgi:hypothetical protein
MTREVESVRISKRDVSDRLILSPKSARLVALALWELEEISMDVAR